MLKLFAITIVTAALTHHGVALVRRWALRGNVVDVPNQRSSHTQPTPRGGGLAIDIVVVTMWVAFTLICVPSEDWLPCFVFAGAVTLIATVSWLDDLYSLSNRSRFAVHLIAAIVAMFFMHSWKDLDLPWLGTVRLNSCFVWPLTLLWIVGLTSAYNFMDGIDGIAGLQAVAAGLGWTAIAAQSGRTEIIVLSLILVGASVGFLGHNWPPARIFMGDVGSTALGFSFSVIPLLYNSVRTPQPRVDPLVAVLLVWPFVYDASFTFIRRLWLGENVFQAHRSHLYQRLTIAGWSHRSVSLLYFGLALIGAALAWLYNNGMTIMLAAVPPLCLALALSLLVVSQEKKLSRLDPSVPQNN